MKTIKRSPIGAVGMIEVLKDVNARFRKASESWPEGVVPTIGDCDLVYEKCHRCHGNGKRDSSYCPKGGMAPVWCLVDCDICGGTGKLGHPFPSQLVKLAKLLANHD